MKVALLSNVTTSVLEGLLRKSVSVWSPPGFGAWLETALDPPADFLAFAPDAIYLLLDERFAAVDRTHLQTAVARLETRFPACPVVVPDLACLARDLGEAFYDARMWQLGKMPWSLKGLRELAKFVTPVKKVLALDLDGTLWAGAIGEDGVSGIRPKEDLLRDIRALKARGIVLTVLSKNNPADVEPAFASLLSHEDFVGMRIGWEPKSENLASLARELNVGTDAFVFVDDNPAERAEMRVSRPEVCVADFPPQLDCFFPPHALTREDREKTLQYRAEAKRRALAAELSPEDYLASLDIRTDIHALAADEVPRVAQLSQKANQFNVRTNRYAEDDIRRFSADPQHLILTMHARDRFGDQGLVAFVHAAASDAYGADADRPAPCWEILDWVMSCRAMNRRLEFVLQERVEAELRRRGADRLLACWFRTAKNVPVRDLFERFGFTVTEASDGEKRYERFLQG